MREASKAKFGMDLNQKRHPSDFRLTQCLNSERPSPTARGPGYILVFIMDSCQGIKKSPKGFLAGSCPNLIVRGHFCPKNKTLCAQSFVLADNPNLPPLPELAPRIRLLAALCQVDLSAGLPEHP